MAGGLIVGLWELPGGESHIGSGLESPKLVDLILQVHAGRDTEVGCKGDPVQASAAFLV